MNRKFKRIISIMICLILVLSTAGCGKQAGSGNGENSDEKGGKEVNVNNGSQSGKTAKYQDLAAIYPETVNFPQYDSFVDEKTGDMNYDAYSKAYDEYLENQEKLSQAAEGAQIAEKYYEATIKQLLLGADGENCIYSPLNVYMALAMLAETTAGDTRDQILDLLEVDSIEEMRRNAQAVWNSSYSDDGVLTTKLGASAWLRDNYRYNTEAFENLIKHYYSSVYFGEMGSEELNNKLRNWLDEQTGGLLKDQTKDVKLTNDTIMALATTVYFKGSWRNKFSEYANGKKIFHGTKNDTETEFMNDTSREDVYGGKNFTATVRDFEGNASMYLILPDEGVSVDDLINDNTVVKLVNGVEKDKLSSDIKQKNVELTLSIPKFDVNSKLNLNDALKKLGVTDAFDVSKADFSPITEEKGIYVSEVQHAARVKIDEEGCEAAAYTLIMNETTALIEREKMELVFDRPFIFVITDKSGNVLFTGIVNQL